MELNKDYLKQIWDSVWEEGIPELDMQKRYFDKLNQILKGEDRYYLETLQRKKFKNLKLRLHLKVTSVVPLMPKMKMTIYLNQKALEMKEMVLNGLLKKMKMATYLKEQSALKKKYI